MLKMCILLDRTVDTASIGYQPKKRIPRQQQRRHEGFKFTVKDITQPASSYLTDNNRGTSPVSHWTFDKTLPTVTGPPTQFPSISSSRTETPQSSTQNHYSGKSIISSVDSDSSGN